MAVSFQLDYAAKAQMDMIKFTLQDINETFALSLEQGIYDEEFYQHIVALSNLPSDTITRYINEGSFYPVLELSMQKAEYQKIITFFNVVGKDFYVFFQTPEIRLCRAACLFQLNEQEKCKALLQEEDLQILDQMIYSNQAGRIAYQNLQHFLYPQQDPEASFIDFQIHGGYPKG